VQRAFAGPGAGDDKDRPWFDFSSWPGAVVATERDAPEGKSTTTLKSASKAAVPDSAFKLPDGFTESKERGPHGPP